VVKSAQKPEQNQNGRLIKIEESEGRKNFVKFFTIFHATKELVPRAEGNCVRTAETAG
jgi:hypothetical protein